MCSPTYLNTQTFALKERHVFCSILEEKGQGVNNNFKNVKITFKELKFSTMY